MTVESNKIQADHELEQIVLGAVLIDAKGCEIHVNTHAPDLFHKDSHRDIWNAFKSLLRKGEAIDIISVTKELRTNGKLDRVGGPYYISSLTNRVTSSATIGAWLLTLKQLYIARWMAIECGASLRKSFDDTIDPLDLLEDHRKRIESIADFRNLQDGRSFVEILNQSVEEGRARELANREGRPIGIDTGLYDLNRHIGGWQKGELIVLGARPSMGKSSVALHFAKTAAIHNVPVVFFSLEMSDVRLSDKLLMSMVSIQSNDFKYGKLTAYDWNQIDEAKKYLESLPFHIIDKPMMTIGQIRSMAKSIEGIGMVVIDYMQLIAVDGDKRNRTREQEVSEISRQCKQLAKELNIPVIALSQLSRSVEHRGGAKRPTLSDLRESGAIEQDADMVMFLHRADYYDDEVRPEDENVIEAIIAKFRDGATGNITFKRSHDFSQFFDRGSATIDKRSKFGNPIPIADPNQYNPNQGIEPNENF